MRSKVSRNFVLLAPPSCGEVSANKSANVGALIFIVTLFGSVLIIAYHPPFVQRFLSFLLATAVWSSLAAETLRLGISSFAEHSINKALIDPTIEVIRNAVKPEEAL